MPASHPMSAHAELHAKAISLAQIEETGGTADLQFEGYGPTLLELSAALIAAEAEIASLKRLLDGDDFETDSIRRGTELPTGARTVPEEEACRP